MHARHPIGRRLLAVAIGRSTARMGGVAFRYLLVALASASITVAGPAAASPESDKAAWSAQMGRNGQAHFSGQVQQLIGPARRGLKLAERAFGIDSREAASSATFLGDLYYEAGRHADAVPLYERALAWARRQPAVYEMLIMTSTDKVNTVHNLAVCYAQLERYGDAAPLFDEALRGATRWMGAGHLQTLRLSREVIMNRLANPALASGAIEPARALAAVIRSRRSTMDLPGIVDVHSTRQIGNSSRDVLGDLGLANVQATRARGNDLDAFVMLADADWADATRRSAYQDEAFAALQDAVSGTAGKAVEQMAVRVAAEHKKPGLGALVRERQALDDAATANADEAARLVGYRGDDWIFRSGDNYVAGFKIKTDQERLDARLRVEFPDYFDSSGRNTLDLASTQSVLGADEAMLLVVPTAFGSHVFAITKTEVQWRRSSWNRVRVAAAARRLMWDVGANVGVDSATSAKWEKEGGAGYPFDRNTAHALYRELIGPVESLLAGKRHVFIVAGGVLSSLPFGILVTKPPSGADGDASALRATKWFADAHALVTIPTVQSLKFLRQIVAGGGAGDGEFAGYGDPVLAGEAVTRGRRTGRTPPSRAIFQGGASRGAGLTNVGVLRSLARLPGTGVELEAMRTALGAPASAVHLQGAATEAAIRAADLSRVRILALATHGLMAGEMADGAEPGLVLSPPAIATAQDDGFLTASEVAGLKLDADWVILSACNTAAGDGSEGAPGLSGLARAFFYSGARALLVSHWPVRDAVAARITVDTIQRRRSNPGMSRAEGLQAAMRAIRDDPSHDTADDSWAHPNAWAPFSLIGDGAR